MKKTSILCIILAAAVVLLCAKLALNNSKSQANQDNVTNIEDATYNSIMTRTSIRKFQDKAIESDKIEKLLRAGMAAPTAVNKQPWHFVVITDANIMKNVSRQGEGAPLGIAVCGDMDKALGGEARDFWVQDASAATENILLAAHAMGLGAVWTGVYPIINRCTEVAETLQLPGNIIPLNIIIIGYPAEEPAVKDKWNTANISYNVYGGNR
ncbi:MAG: nitroreductase family protein [Bacteroidales bacterium]|nr:nitroreductase family protein [Bacteroidales bacterium]